LACARSRRATRAFVLATLTRYGARRAGMHTRPPRTTQMFTDRVAEGQFAIGRRTTREGGLTGA
jgi:hypothetical protein